MAWIEGERLTPDQMRERLTMTGGEVCATLGICESTLRKWVHQGVIPAKKVGRKVYFPTADVLALFGQS